MVSYTDVSYTEEGDVIYRSRKFSHIEMTFDQCYGLNVSPQKSYTEILIPEIMVLRGVAFGGNWVMRVEPSRLGLVPLRGNPTGTSLAVQWLRIHTSIAGDMVLIPGSGTKIPNTMWYGQKINKKKNRETPQSFLAPSAM